MGLTIKTNHKFRLEKFVPSKKKKKSCLIRSKIDDLTYDDIMFKEMSI